MAKLNNPKAEAFLQEFLIDRNKTKAAIRAGYSARTADVQSSQMLNNPKIAARLRELEKEEQTRCHVDTDWVLEQYAQIAKFQLTDIGDFDGNTMSFKPSKEWGKTAHAAVSSVKQKTTTRITPSGEPVVTNEIEFKFNSKQAALDSISKHLGLFGEFNLSIATLRRFGIELKQDINGQWFVYDTIKTIDADNTSPD